MGNPLLIAAFLAVGGCIVGSGVVPRACAQAMSEVFRLATPDGQVESRAEKMLGRLVITDPAGVVTVYQREPRYDTADRQYEGYYSRAARRAVRWPVRGSGAMQLADALPGDPRPPFRVSRMRVAPVTENPSLNSSNSLAVPSAQAVPSAGGISIDGIGPFRPLTFDIPVDDVGAPGVGQTGRLTTRDALRAGFVLEARAGRPARMNLPAEISEQYWVLIPVRGNIVRLQFVDRGELWSLSATGPAGAVVMQPTRRDATQLWRAVGGAGIRLDSVAYPGRSLAGSADGLVALERTSGAAAQLWLVRFAAPPPALVIPPVRLAQVEQRPHAELPPARVRFENTHHNELTVVLANLRTGRPQEIRIPAGGSQTVELARDSGGLLVERYEVLSPTGRIVGQQTITEIPPTVLYDVSVYERFLQSIAIDRTGTSPQVIEDVNYQRKSVGFFPLPAGRLLQDGTRIDVWNEAQAFQNPGGVRPLPPAQPPRDNIDPLERILREQRNAFPR